MVTRLLMGAATAILRTDDGINTVSPKPRFTGGGEFAFNLYLSPVVAINLGMVLISKGYRADEILEEDGFRVEVEERMTFLTMELPMGVLLNLSGFRIGIDMVVSYLLHGRAKGKLDGDSYESDIDNWDQLRRLNIGPRVSLGYAIPAGPVAVVPGAFWEMDFLNVYDLDQELIDLLGGDMSYRHMSIMASLGLEFSM